WRCGIATTATSLPSPGCAPCCGRLRSACSLDDTRRCAPFSCLSDHPFAGVTLDHRKLGELEVSAVGLGCATMTPFYGEPDPASAVETIRRAGELGIDFLDTSDAYGNGRNEELISRAVEGRRREYVIASKFGNLRRPDGTPT